MLTVNGREVTFALELAVTQGANVVSLDSAGGLIVLGPGEAVVRLRPRSTALATDTLRADVALHAAVPRLVTGGPDTLFSVGDSLLPTVTPVTRTGVPIAGTIPVTWQIESGDTAVTLLDAATGRVRALRDGDAVLRARADTATVARQVLVRQRAVELVPPAPIVFRALGQTRQLAPQVSDARLNAVSNATIAWVSRNPAAVTVSSAGLVTGVGVGTSWVVMTATGPGGGTPSAVDSTLVTVSLAHLGVLSGDNQTGSTGRALAQPFVVQLLDAASAAVTDSGVRVIFAVASGDGRFSGGRTADSVTTNPQGRASTTLTVGTSLDSTVVTATGTGLAGAAARFVAKVYPPRAVNFDVEPRNLVAGGVIVPAVQVSLRDTNNVLTSGAPGVVRLELIGGKTGAHLSGDTMVAVQAGVATHASLSIDSAAVGYRLVATAVGMRPDTSALFYVVAAAASRLAFRVHPSATPAGEAIAPPIEVEVQDAFGNHVASSADVTLDISTVPIGGTSTVNGTRIVTAVNGLAMFSNVIIANAANGYTLRASSFGLASATSLPFNITAVVGPPASVTKVSGDNQNGIVGATLAQPFVVQVRDAASNPVTGDSVIFKVTAGGGKFAGADSLIVLTGATGQVSATLTLGSSEGTHTATARSTKLPAQPVTFTASATPPDLRLAFVTQPSNATGGATISPAIQVAVQDQSGVTQTTATTNVSLSLTSGTGTSGASLRGTATVGAVNGVARFTNVNVDRAGTGYTLTASATGVQSATSAGFAVTVGPAAQLAFFTVPANGVAGASLGSIQIEVQDLGGNRVTSSSTAVTMAIAAGTGTANANLRGTRTVNASAGLAAFGTLSIDSAGTGYRLSATATLGMLQFLTETRSSAFDIAPAPAARLAFTSQPSSAVAGATLGTVVVAVRDSLGNLVTTANTPVTLALQGGTAGASLRGTRTANPIGGLATFTGLSVDSAGTGYTLAASAPGLVGVNSASFSITVGPVARLRFLVQPSPTGPLAAITPAVKVAVQDSMGNTVTTSSATVAVAFAGTPGVTLGGTTSVNAASGVAAFSNLTVSAAATGLRLVATSGALRPDTSTAFDVTSAPINRLSFSAEPSSTTAGAVFAVTVRVADASNNTVTSATDSINLAFQPGTGTAGAHLLGVVGKRASAGVAQFTGLRVDSAGTGYRIIATSSLLTPDTSQVFDVTAGAARRLDFVVEPTSRAAGQVFSPALQVAVRDSVGNTVTTYATQVALAIQAGTGAAGATLAGTTSLTPASGVATYTDVSIAAAGTGYRLIASSGSLAPDTSVAFSVGVRAVARVLVTPAGASVATAGGTQTFTAEARDSLGNTISGKTFTWASLNPNVATVNSSTGVATAVASGQVTVSATVDGLTGYALLTVAIGGATPVNLWAPVSSSTSSHLSQVWGSSPDDIWAVGTGGTIVRYDGRSWSTVRSGGNELDGVWGTGPRDVWATGQGGTILRYDGTTWTSLASPVSTYLYDVWGAGPTDVWAAGQSGRILHFNGTTWDTIPHPTSTPLARMWGSSSSNIWLGGAQTPLLHYDGSSWSVVSVPASIHAVWGTNANDVLATGDSATLVRFDGSQWSRISVPTTSPLGDIWGGGPDDVWIVTDPGSLLHYDGASWTIRPIPTSSRLEGVWGAGASDVWVVGHNGTIIRGARGATVSLTPSTPTLAAVGATVTVTATARDAASQTISGVTFAWTSSNTAVATVNSSGLVTAVANGTATITATVTTGTASGSTTLSVSQTAASITVSPSGASISGGTQTFTAQARDANGNLISGKTFTWASLNTNVATINSSTGVATAVASGQVTVSATVDGVTGHGLLTVAVDGAVPNLWVQVPSGTTAYLHGVWGTSASNVLAVGLSGTILRWNGTSWTSQVSGTGQDLNGVWGTSPANMYAVGSGGTILRFDGTTWTAEASGTSEYLNRVWGTSPTNVFVTGRSGTILRWDGASWAPMASGTGDILVGVWGTSPTNVFAVDETSGGILRYDGATWTAQGSGNPLVGVWGTSPTNAFAVGYAGRILHWDGTSWTPVASGTGQVLNGVWGTSPTNVYAEGAGGTLLRWDGASWSTIPSGTSAYLQSIWVTSPTEVLAVGEGGVIVRGLAGATVTVTPASATLNALAGTQQLRATARDAASNTITGVTFTWTSSNTAVATVSSSGLVTAVANGTATITATVTSGTAAGSTTVTVSQTAASITVSPSGAPISGGTQTFTAEARDANGNVISGKTFTWASLNPNVATINSSTGVATAVASGQVTISATADGVPGYGLLTVATPGATPPNLWAPMTTGASVAMFDVWGTSASNVFAVGQPNPGTGTILRYDGTTWSEMPAPAQPSGLVRIRGTSASNLYAVGPFGTILHYDGTSWTAMASGTSQHLWGVWAASPTAVYAVGENGTILRFNGNTWSPMTSGTTQILGGVWGTSASDVFVVGNAGTILRFDGTAWSPMTSGTGQDLLGVWGTSTSNVFAAGYGGTILRFNGTAWSPTASGTTLGSGFGIWGTSASDVYAGFGTGRPGEGLLLRYDGTSWTPVTTGTIQTPIGIWGIGSSDVFAGAGTGVILRGVRGATVTVTPPSPTLTAIGATQQLTAMARDPSSNVVSSVIFTWSSSNTSVATVNSSGLVTAVANGTATVTATAPGGAAGTTTVTVAQVAASVVVSPAGASITGGTQTFTAQARDASGNAISGKTFTWASLNPNVATINSSTGVAAAVASGQVTVSATVDGKVGYGLLTVAIPGAVPVNLWVLMSSPTTTDVLEDVWGTSGTDVYVTGYNGTYRYDGTNWITLVGTPNSGYSIWGTSSSDLYVAGGPNRLAHYNGATWSTGGPTVYPFGVWGSSPIDVVAVGVNSNIQRYDGISWISQLTGTTADLHYVWGSSRSDVFAVGIGGAIRRYAGSAWSIMTGATGSDLYGVWGTSDSDVFAVGVFGVIQHYNGTAWSLMTSLYSNLNLQAVWGSSGSDVFAVGTQSGAGGGNFVPLLYYDGSTWSQLSIPTSGGLRGVWGIGSDVFLVGDGGTIVRGVRGATVVVTSANPTLTAIGATQQMTATARDAASNVISGVIFTWSSSNTAVATVNSSGLVTAVAHGTATITATAPGGAAGSTTVTVAPNFALDFSNDYVEIADAPSLDLGAAWTLETWVYPRNVGATGFHHVISKWGGAGNASYALEVRAGRLRVGIHDGTTSHVIESDSLLANGVWQHLAIVFESGTVRLYINGTLDTSTAGIPAPMNSASPVRFGAEAAELWTYDGLIDEIRAWNVARTSAQIAAARTQRLAGNETGLVGYWRFDEGAGDSAGDATANGNHGRLGGAAGADVYDPSWVSGGAPVTTAAASANLRLASGR